MICYFTFYPGIYDLGVHIFQMGWFKNTNKRQDTPVKVKVTFNVSMENPPKIDGTVDG